MAARAAKALGLSEGGWRATARAPARRMDGLTLFLADLDPAYCKIREISKLGRNAVNSNEVFIHDLPVPDEDVVGEVGRAHAPRSHLAGDGPELRCRACAGAAPLILSPFVLLSSSVDRGQGPL